MSNPLFNRALLITLLTAVSFHASGKDAAAESLAAKLKMLYPATTFGSVSAVSVMPGLFEVEVGKNVIYTDKEGRYFLFGHLYDMKEQVDMTAEKTVQAPAVPSKVEFADLPVQDAIRTIRGNGERHIAVFADPNCGYCKQFESELLKIDNITVDTYLIPILSDDSRTKSARVWCASDRTRAWADLMLRGKLPKENGNCDSGALDRNLSLAMRLGIQGTPSFVFRDGTLGYGMKPAAALLPLLKAP